MLRTLIFSTALMMYVNLVCGQTSDFEQIIKEWNEGKIDANGNVIDGGTRRGGWDYLCLNSDSTVIYSDAFSCGFGSRRTGTWSLDKTNALITFLFKNTEGCMNNPENGEIDLIETYFIEKLTETELILLYQNSSPPRQIAFFKN